MTSLAEGGRDGPFRGPCVHAWLDVRTLVLLTEGPGGGASCFAAVEIVGSALHDARIVALCRAHGVREPSTADRDFSRLGGLTVLLDDSARDRAPRHGRRARARV